jgi:hypothetical protein
MTSPGPLAPGLAQCPSYITTTPEPAQLRKAFSGIHIFRLMSSPLVVFVYLGTQLNCGSTLSYLIVNPELRATTNQLITRCLSSRTSPP